MSRRALSDNRIEQRRAEDLMREALSLAAQTQPHPNPRVGALVVSGGSVVGTGAHHRAGEAHAEVNAIRAAGSQARGATIYVTLEPCSHEGRTPPCVDAIIDSGIERVVIGALDPDTRVDGSGVDRLRGAGINVVHGILATEVEALDPGYFHHRRTGLPLITLKLATTLDGQVAAADRTSQWITGREAREDGHRLRADADVVVVGAGTLLDDDPGLDVRLRGYRGRQPRPVVIAGGRPLPADAALFKRDPLIYTSELCDLPAEQVIVPGGDRVDLSAVLTDLGKRGYVAALVEGGPTLARALLEGRYVDRLVLFFGSKLGMGTGLPAVSGSFETLEDALDIEIDAVVRLGNDIRIDARLVG